MECKDFQSLPENQSIKCINRNIVECKEVQIININIWFLCINRNIVECKGQHHTNGIGVPLVLIET